ncbi:MAG: hypothetical protein AAGK22_30195 [Acidobacteriota bacterium]
MPILSGSASLTRFTVNTQEIDLESQEFRTISPGSEIQESIGIVPFEPEGELQIGPSRWAFRVRIDTLRPDPTAVRERLNDLLRIEMEESGHPTVGARKRKELRNLAREEMLLDARPTSKIIECVIDDRVLYVGTTANSVLGKIVLLLRRAGVIADFKAPWIDLQQADTESELLDVYEPGQSIHGSRFAQKLIGDREILVDPSNGYAKLQTREARITLSGGVLPDLVRYVEEGAELLGVKLVTAETSFRLDTLSFRISSLKLEPSKLDHWTEALDERLEKIEGTWDLLDQKYADLMRSGSSRPQAAAAPRAVDGEDADNVVQFEQG